MTYTQDSQCEMTKSGDQQQSARPHNSSLWQKSQLASCSQSLTLQDQNMRTKTLMKAEKKAVA